ncbi:WapI family immunity protein [Xenorhabdus siamensis]|uniref:WapI family immunity protein n=1 Tax=Xenorhabdus siamensis TaxID=3136254 RepID=UPI0030F3AE6E
MLVIKNEDIMLEIFLLDKASACEDKYEYYQSTINLYVEFKSKGISFATEWNIFTGELNDFINKIIESEKNQENYSLTFCPMEGMIKLKLSKANDAIGSYTLGFEFSSDIRSEIVLSGTTRIDQSYIPLIIQGLRSLLQD